MHKLVFEKGFHVIEIANPRLFCIQKIWSKQWPSNRIIKMFGMHTTQNDLTNLIAP